MKNFWKKINKPIMVLAPMADVTDAAFRRVIARYGKPDVMWTEFVSADGLMLAGEEGRAKLMKDLIYTNEERPIVAQFFTARPEMMEKAATLACELGFDGIDINMGCPDRSIERQGAGAALMKNPKLAREVIRAAKKGAASGDREIPVSVKTRIGFHKNEIETWLPELLAENPAAITLHARTRKEMSKVPAHWDVLRRAVEIRNELKSDTLILGNGDVESIEDAKQKAGETGADGIMLGRAIFGNPWLFNNQGSDVKVNIEQKLKVMVEHTKLFSEILGGTLDQPGPERTGKNFAVMKKHYKAYVAGWDGAKELRMKLMETESAEDVEMIVKKYLSQI